MKPGLVKYSITASRLASAVKSSRVRGSNPFNALPSIVDLMMSSGASPLSIGSW
ncbi:unnamed protein product [Arabidopsis lyrata]|uniref:Predicted protein n=1 Tax=Arabidopsis lyrata subsp. lyrata TaxID=81972 RepID=D7L882_ARALL|nr:predicted protein [Arabidopsis lyrata subsp. lyrata]CAH8262684.1 unnamed protein product [Arabidopsis lyrata]